MSNNLIFSESSAKTGMNIDEIFYTVGKSKMSFFKLFLNLIDILLFNSIYAIFK